jgi:tRNA modification GTPase
LDFLSSDTIFAVSSPTADRRVIIRVSGPAALGACGRLAGTSMPDASGRILPCSVAVEGDLRTDARLYVFRSPNSYTGEDMVEIHLDTNGAVTGRILQRLAGMKLRAAAGGEFTARRYLNGKIDLSRAEAVAETVAAGNRFQLEAAGKLLSGRLSAAVGKLLSSITDLLSLIEACLDFSGEELEFIGRPQVLERIEALKAGLLDLLAGGIRCESLVEMPSVAILGTPNAGKSSLLNALTGTDRCIVAAGRKTTRDVLAGLLELRDNSCVLFDCAGLSGGGGDILDGLARDAALEAARNSDLVLFCVDSDKGDPAEDMAIRRTVDPKDLLAVATKSDLLTAGALRTKIDELEGLFGTAFLPVSSRTGSGIETLRNAIDGKLTRRGRNQETAGPALTARHGQAVSEALEYITAAGAESADYEVAAVMLRNAWQCLSTVNQQGLNEQVLRRIFSRFCVGK